MRILRTHFPSELKLIYVVILRKRKMFEKKLKAATMKPLPNVAIASTTRFCRVTARALAKSSLRNLKKSNATN
jgi:hypothetical protein